MTSHLSAISILETPLSQISGKKPKSHHFTKNSPLEDVFVCLSLLTMTNPNQLCDVLLFVCSKMTDETNLSSKLSVADTTREV